jgi:prepilin-type N-terminal cleavage/methylation domain-containing protein
MPARSRTKATGRDSLTQKSSEGFTILELLIVVAIIGALAAIAVPVYNKFINNAKLTSAHATLDTIRKNLESYHLDYQNYPDSINFVTGQDGIGRIVFEPEFVNQITGDLTSVDSYVMADNTYTLVVRARDDQQTVMTLTPQEITY